MHKTSSEANFLFYMIYFSSESTPTERNLRRGYRSAPGLVATPLRHPIRQADALRAAAQQISQVANGFVQFVGRQRRRQRETEEESAQVEPRPVETVSRQTG